MGTVCTSAASLFLLSLAAVLQLTRRHLHGNESALPHPYIYSCLFSTEANAIFSKALSTPCLFLALVVMCLILGCLAKNSCTSPYSTSRSSSRSILFPTRMNGNFSGYLGAPWLRNSVIHDSMLSKDCLSKLVHVCWWCRKRVHNSRLHDRRRHPDCGIFPVLLCPISRGWWPCHRRWLPSPWNRPRLWPCRTGGTSGRRSCLIRHVRVEKRSLAHCRVSQNDDLRQLFLAH